MRIGDFAVFLISMKFFFSFQLAVYRLDAYLFNVEDEIYINGLEFTEKFFFYLGVDTACLLK